MKQELLLMELKKRKDNAKRELQELQSKIEDDKKSLETINLSKDELSKDLEVIKSNQSNLSKQENRAKAIVESRVIKLMSKVMPVKPLFSFSDPEKAVECLFEYGDVFAVEKVSLGMNVFVHKQKNNISIFDSFGKDLTGYFDVSIEKAKQLTLSDFIIECDLVQKDGKKIVELSVPGSDSFKEDSVAFYATDLIYFDKDISFDPWVERRKIMESRFKWNVKFNSAPALTVSTKDEALKAINLVSKLKGAKGVVLKDYHSFYSNSVSKPYSVLLRLNNGQ